MTDKRRPTANEYKLLKRLANGEVCCATGHCRKKGYGGWKVGHLYAGRGPDNFIADSTVRGLIGWAWAKREYKSLADTTYILLTSAGHKAYEDEKRRQSETQT